jgi:hypothetical protein
MTIDLASRLEPTGVPAIGEADALLARVDAAEVAHALERLGDLLEIRGASPFRVSAYRRAARTLRESPRPLAEILKTEGPAGLERLPGIGRSLARAISELLATGRLRHLERLEYGTSPEAILTTLPGLGPGLARRIHEALHVDTLESLEVAAYDGRLERLPGIGPRRLRMIRSVLDASLGHRPGIPHVGNDNAGDAPPIHLLLEMDNDYRVGAELGVLPTVPPRRFNPTGARRLPVLEEQRDGWRFTAFYSNSARAHAAHATHDWVIIRARHATDEHLATIVTETRGRLAGRRVVRGREGDCHAHYATKSPGRTPPAAKTA